MYGFGRHIRCLSRLNLVSGRYLKPKAYTSVSSAAAVDMHKTLKVGHQLHGYEVKVVDEVPELCLSAYLLDHLKTGAQHLHIQRDDNNNMFGVSLRTTPADSTGVAHILEHLSLCGSEKFPVRDPFFKMLNRSLTTFMNAFTTPDHTFYPFSTQNLKDYYNLMTVYLDAVFFPLLQPLDFNQEGWRLEHQDINDPQSDIIFKGVVFNEMKGVFSSPAAIYVRSLQNHLFPDTTYANESGGDPLVIPELKYEDLKEFHRKHYHPSNARFITYGNFPLESHLAFIDDYVLNRFNLNENFRNSTEARNQPKWSKPMRKEIQSQPDPLAPFPDKQTTVSISYMLEDKSNTHECFTLSIICSLLMDGPNSPLYQALIDSGLGSDYSPNSGFAGYTKQAFFSIGLQGIAKKDVNFVVKAIDTALKNASNDGFPEERIEAILHRLELSTKYQTNNYGLGLAMNLNSIWTHDCNPIVGLKVNDHVNRFRKELKQNPKLLEQKIKEYFISNTHRLVLEMNPSEDFEKNLREKEQNLLNEKLRKLSKEDLKDIYNKGIQLEKQQNDKQKVDILPTLVVKTDISRSFDATNVETTQISNTSVQWSAQPTNGITYFNAILKPNFSNFPQHLVPYLPLFNQVATKLGAGSLDRKQLDQEIQLLTGGLQMSVHVTDHPSQFDLFEKGLIISSHCLERNIDHMFRLLTNIFNSIRFDDDYDHLLQLIRISSAELAMSLPHYGQRYAMQRSAAALGGAFKFREQTSGLSSVDHFRSMASLESSEPVVEHLKSIADLLLNSDSMRCSINAEASTIRSSLQSVEKFINSLNKRTEPIGETQECGNNGDIPAIESMLNEHHVLPFANNYLGKSVYCTPFVHNDYAKLKIAANLVSAKYLLREVREKGGAYGGGAKFNLGGVYSYYSYRDPNVEQTIDAFNDSAQWLANQSNYSEQDIDEAKLSVFQEVDHPIMPSEQGLLLFVNGITDQMRHDYRMRLLDVTKADIEEVAKRYLVNEKLHSGVVLIGPRNDRTLSDPKWLIIEDKPNN
ncbi:presequence protease, mitochondrial-like [Oppia nitens]|uniref:presequence protease, mitochondrial-like n=1 Tax=Oppia nitens TaxID=1686743 RepID=UPI0023DA5D76|nr:presequence protease, mitochondrial-like [Oppia nitens]